MDNETKSDGPTVSRRSFMATTAVGGVALGAAMTMKSEAQTDTDGGGSTLSSGGSGGAGGGATEPDGIRRNIYAAMGDAQGRQMIESYRRGVAAMKAKPFSDPTSWTFQAAKHDRALEQYTPELPVNSDQAIAALPPDLQFVLNRDNNCQHGNPFFPAWHRIYLYYFEKMIRKSSGDPTFMLPYWNYSDSTAERVMPEAFRTPADRDQNALYEPLRRQNINTGSPLSASVVSTTVAMNQSRAIAGSPDLGFYTRLELQPHNVVHGGIGGRWIENGNEVFGLMSLPQSAALDPIFWLHHCNIDRLWAKWVRDGHADEVHPLYLGQRYAFVDEDGNIVNMTVQEVLDTAAQLDYTYDDDSGPEAGFVVAGNSGVESGQLADDLAVFNEPITLGTAPIVMEAAPVVESGGAALFTTDVSDPGEKPVYLVLEGLQHDETVPVFYNLYVNRPDDVPATEENGYFAGLFYPFSPTGEEKQTMSFDITGLLNRQIRDGLYESGPLKIEVIPTDAEGVGIDGSEVPSLTVERIAIVR